MRTAQDEVNQKSEHNEVDAKRKVRWCVPKRAVGDL